MPLLHGEGFFFFFGGFLVNFRSCYRRAPPLFRQVIPDSFGRTFSWSASPFPSSAIRPCSSHSIPTSVPPSFLPRAVRLPGPATCLVWPLSAVLRVFSEAFFSPRSSTSQLPTCPTGSPFSCLSAPFFLLSSRWTPPGASFQSTSLPYFFEYPRPFFFDCPEFVEGFVNPFFLRFSPVSLGL